MDRYDKYMSRLKEGCYINRLNYINQLINLHKGIKGSKLYYDMESKSTVHVFLDLVLVDKKGKELGRVTSTNPVGWICNHFIVLK